MTEAEFYKWESDFTEKITLLYSDLRDDWDIDRYGVNESNCMELFTKHLLEYVDA